MVDVTDQSANQSTSTVRNSSAAIAVLLLALTPQIFELAWSLGAFIFRFAAGRNPAQALIDHVFALAWAIPSLAGSFGTNGKAALSSDILLALIYSYPLAAVAVLTLFVRFRAPQDYFGGIVLVAIGLFALWASSDLQGMHGFSFGAGTAPRMFAGLLVALGAGVVLMGLLFDGVPLATYAWRGPLFISLSILSFAITVRPLGLVISAFASFMISSLGAVDIRWKETIIVGICLTIGCSLLFPYALGLPLQLFPRFLVQ